WGAGPVPGPLLTTAGASPGQPLLLPKPLGTGVLINAFKFDKLDEAGLEPALVEMGRADGGAAPARPRPPGDGGDAARLALAHGVTAATDVTGFALVGHALGMAKASGAGIRIAFERLPAHD